MENASKFVKSEPIVIDDDDDDDFETPSPSAPIQPKNVIFKDHSI